MQRPKRLLPLTVLPAILLALLVAGCSRPGDGTPASNAVRSEDRDESPGMNEAVKAAVLGLEYAYWEAEKAGDWSVVAGLVAPDYYGVGDDFEINLAEMKRDFPRIKLSAYKLEEPRFKLIERDLAVISYAGRINELFDGKDISGRYWFSSTYVRRGDQWKLLIEQEVRINQAPPSSN
jgi:Domain of unknown function (DUF4440)